MMEFDILDDGNLKVTSSPEDRAGLDTPEDWEEAFYEAVRYDGWDFVPPEAIGALTDAPIICDDAHTIDDEGTFVVYPEAQVWWFPNYMIEDPVNTLMTLGEVVFMAAPTEGGGTSR